MSGAEIEPPLPAPLLGDYRPAGGAFDELLEANGQVRPHWQTLLTALQRITPEDLIARRENTRRFLREHGATYNTYEDTQSMGRPWSLDLLPLILAPAEWRELEAGLVQRARLLNLTLADIYGPQCLLQEGLLPPALLFANPGFLRPCHGVRPRADTFLFFHAFDLARSPDGRWWVLDDRTQAPSGLGYALANRLVISRVFPDEFRDCRVQRLAGFFQSARDMLRNLAPAHQDHPNVILLTPGPYNETYFEQVFLARYLGFPLLEGGDLTVRDRRVFIKTLEGLQPVDVILRRLDDTFCDPLELRADSSLGVPGLLEAARAGNVTIANALGSGAVETPALAPFLPSLCRRLLGEELLLPSVATWWCGQEKEFDHVCAQLNRFVIRRAFAPSSEPIIPARLDEAGHAALLIAMKAAPHDFVAEERVALSSVPSLENERLEPRPMVFRASVCATPNGYLAMPGGLTRFSSSAEGQVSSMQPGSSKDTWVLADGPVGSLSLLQVPPQVLRLDRAPSEVPSRVADNLFWLGRYAERLEDTVRVLRCVLVRLTGEGGAEETPELTALVRLLVHLDLFPARFRTPSRLAGVERELYLLIYHAHRLGTIRDVTGRLRQLAFALRDRFSADTWRILSKLQVDAAARPGRVQAADALTLLNTLIADLAAFSGMEMENMTRGHGWRFLDLGRRLERAVNVITLAQAARSAEANEAVLLDPLLEIADSVMTYRRLYFAQPQWPAVLHLLLAEESNPRSLTFQLQALMAHAGNLPGENLSNGLGRPGGQLTGILQELGHVDWHALAASSAESRDQVVTALLARCALALRSMSDSITHLYFSHAETRIS